MTVYECALHWRAGSNDYYNVVHYDITGDTPLDLQSLTDNIASEWTSTYRSRVTSTVLFSGVVFRLDIDGSVGTEIQPTGGELAGTSANGEWAGQVAMLIRKKTNGLVRPVQGRAYVPGLVGGNLNSFGEFSTTALADVEAFWDNIILVPFAGNGQAEMLIKASNPAAPNTNPYNSVAECEAAPIPSVLQSRKKGRGA